MADDAEEVARLRRETYTYKVLSADAARHMITVQSPGERFLALVAESEGRLVGWGSAGLNVWTSEEGQGNISVYVHPEHRLQGIGGALSDRLHDHLREIGAVRVSTATQPSGLDFAKRRGYDGTRQTHFSGIDPRVLPELPATPEGVELKRIDELQPEQVYARRLDLVAGRAERFAAGRCRLPGVARRDLERTRPEPRTRSGRDGR